MASSVRYSGTVNFLVRFLVDRYGTEHAVEFAIEKVEKWMAVAYQLKQLRDEQGGPHTRTRPHLSVVEEAKMESLMEAREEMD